MDNLADWAQSDYAIKVKYFYLILSFFLATWLISNVAAIKVISVWGITLTGGFFSYPLMTTLNIIIIEVYGYKFARQAIISGCILNLTYLLVLNLVNIIPPSPQWELQNEFQTILISQSRVLAGSLISFAISGFLNSYLMAKLKIKGWSLLKRVLVASCISLSIDIILFFNISFLGAMNIDLLTNMFIYAFIKKIICEILLLPAIWLLVDFFKKIEGFEVCDIDTNFNPLSLDNVYDISAYKKFNRDNSIQIKAVVL